MRAALKDDSGDKGKAWRSDLRDAVSEAIKAVRGEAIDGAIGLVVVFVYKRPKKHFSKKGLRPDAPRFKLSAPDTTKLLRGVEDAISGLAWTDDCRVAVQFSTKVYGPEEGARISVLDLSGNGFPYKATFDEFSTRLSEV